MQNLAFEVDELAIAGLVHVSAGVADPAVALIDLPIGSLYLRTNGMQYRKVGPLPNAWEESGSSTGSTTLFGNVDGGLAASVYGGTTPVDGGNASGS